MSLEIIGQIIFVFNLLHSYTQESLVHQPVTVDLYSIKCLALEAKHPLLVFYPLV